MTMQHPKDADGMANNVDPDQPIPHREVCSRSALYAQTYLSKYSHLLQHKL